MKCVLRGTGSASQAQDNEENQGSQSGLLWSPRTWYPHKTKK